MIDFTLPSKGTLLFFQPINMHIKFSDDKKTLTTSSIQLGDDQLKIVCIATNDIGSSESSVLVNVTGK